MGGPSQSSINTQNQLAQQSINVSQQQVGVSQQQEQIAAQAQTEAQANQAQMTALLQPAINYNKGLASGNSADILQTLGPQLTQFSQAKAANAGQINEAIGPGAARDVAQASNIQNTNNSIASLVGQAPVTALDKLASIGTGLGSFSLSQTGAALSGLSGDNASLSGATSSLGSAANINNSVIQEQEQSKASTLGFIGSLAGAGGAALSGTKLFSDRRVKENIEEVGVLQGVTIYSYNYIGDAPENRHRGVMAQQVYELHPDCVIVGEGGAPWMVDYGKLLPRLMVV